MASLDVVFVRGNGRRYRSAPRRADGVDVEMEGGSYNRIGGPAGEVPHDVAHLVVEDELSLERGVWGGAGRRRPVPRASVLAGRRPPHAAERAQEVLRSSVEQLNQAEVLVRAVCDLSVTGAADLKALRAATGARWWAPEAGEAALARAFGRLAEAGARWVELPPGGTLPFTWTPPGGAQRERRRSRRR